MLLAGVVVVVVVVVLDDVEIELTFVVGVTEGKFGVTEGEFVTGMFSLTPVMVEVVAKVAGT